MAYITPNSTIKLLANVPLVPGYAHTVAYTSASEQYTAFNSYAKYTFTAQSYQRVNRNYVRLQVNAENVYDCNYMIFQNSAYGSKWFYAFIIQSNYINDNTTEIIYEIDAFQSWMFNLTLKPCLVLRQHTVTDDTGDNYVPEDLDLGDDYVVVKSEFLNMTNQYFRIYATQTPQGADVTSGTGLYNNVLVPIGVVAGATVSSTGAEIIQAMINDYIDNGKEDAIVGIFQVPTAIPESSTDIVQISITKQNALGGGYTPKNNKCYTYPYNFIHVTDHNGDTKDYRFELFATNTCYFRLFGQSLGTSPFSLLVPQNYKGLTYDYDDGVLNTHFVTIPWVGDTYARWWAQNRNQTIVNGITSIFGGASSGGTTAAGTESMLLGTNLASANATQMGSIATSAVAGAGVAAVGSAGSAYLNYMAKKKDLQATPPEVHNLEKQDDLATVLGVCGYHLYQMTLPLDIIKTIDDYFTVFGYAIKEIETPNIRARPSFTYVQTNGANMSGDIPGDCLRVINQAFDRGITFWTSLGIVGDYSQNNDPS